MSGLRDTSEVANTNSTHRPRSWSYWRWGFAGSLLIGLHLALFLLSPGFAYEREPLAWPVLPLVGIEVFAGALYLLVVRLLGDSPRSTVLLVWAVAVGAVLRVSMLTSTPMLEDDHYRYLWDGAVLANGFNPYTYTPTEVLQSEDDGADVPAALSRLAAESRLTLERVNHPHLRTIYPPVAQAAFALAGRLGQGSLVAWRLVLLGFDVATLCLVIVLLRISGLPIMGLVIYWWNPLVVKEVFNSSHVDVVALPFVVGALLLTIRGRHLWAAGSLALAVGTKIWPIILLPLLLRPVLRNPKRLILALCIFGLLVGAMFFPIYAAGLDGDSGFIAYGREWEMNDALFMLFVWGAQFFVKYMGGDVGQGQLAARFLVLGILVGWTIWLTRKEVKGPSDLCERCLLVVAAMFLLSPTQFPWYYLWVVPFLVVRPRLSLLLLTALLPLYYLRFYFAARGNVDVFDNGIVWLEFVPVWLLLIREWYVERRIAVLQVATA